MPATSWRDRKLARGPRCRPARPGDRSRRRCSSPMPAPATTKNGSWRCSPTTSSAPWTEPTAPAPSGATAAMSRTAISRRHIRRCGNWPDRSPTHICPRPVGVAATAISTPTGGCRGRRSTSTRRRGPRLPRPSISPACRHAAPRSSCAKPARSRPISKAVATAYWRSAPPEPHAPLPLARHSVFACRARTTRSPVSGRWPGPVHGKDPFQPRALRRAAHHPARRDQ